jgi:hypothetical protein
MAKSFGRISEDAGIAEEGEGEERDRRRPHWVRRDRMDWTVLIAVGLLGACAGYLIGLVVWGTYVERGGGEGGDRRLEPFPDRPSGTMTDFDLWELEVAGSSIART